MTRTVVGWSRYPARVAESTASAHARLTASAVRRRAWSGMEERRSAALTPHSVAGMANDMVPAGTRSTVKSSAVGISPMGV